MMVDCNYYLACISASVQSILISVQDGLDISGFNTTFPNVKSKNVGSMSHFSLLPYTRPWILWWLYSKFANFTACLNLLHLPDLPILLHVLISFIPPPPPMVYLLLVKCFRPQHEIHLYKTSLDPQLCCCQLTDSVVCWSYSLLNAWIYFSVSVIRLSIIKDSIINVNIPFVTSTQHLPLSETSLHTWNLKWSLFKE